MKMDRRTLFRSIGGAAFALPYLESLAHGQQAGVPTRLVILNTGEGTLLNRWTPPVAANDALTLSELLQPLAPHQAKLNVVSGVANKVAPMLTGEGGHNVPGHTLLTASACNDAKVTYSSLSLGPSIDAVVANALKVRPLNMCVNGAQVGEYQMYYSMNPQTASNPTGARAPALLESNPGDVFTRLLAPLASTGGTSTPPPTTVKDRLQRQRARVLQSTQDALGRLGKRVSRADAATLDAHAQRLQELATAIGTPATPPTTPTSACSPRAPMASNGSVDASYRATIDVMVAALACGVTRVATLQDTEYDSPKFQDLVPMSADLAKRGAMSLTAPVSGWHQQIHGEQGGTPNDNKNLLGGFLFYAAEMRYLLDSMAAITEANGKTLLDNSLVIWVSEFGDASIHSVQNLPIVMAGSLQGALPTGRHLARTGYSTGDLFTSVLRLFGQNVNSFGLTTDASLNRGGIPGIA